VAGAGGGDQSFVATLYGTLNTKTGAVVMNGTITEGFLFGAPKRFEGGLVDPDNIQLELTAPYAAS
jgi:hypothetical protein